MSEPGARPPIQQRPPACCECHGRGLIKLWSPGKQATTTVWARCEQCSGLGRV